jgi:uncharacterized cupin superfamily protein
LDFGTNIYAALDSDQDRISDDTRGSRLIRPAGATLAGAIWELDPGGSVDYHFHHGAEEMLFVIRGRLTLRTPDGERELAEGDVVHFARGPEGAHGATNGSDSPVRYLMVAAHTTPEVIEYPDGGTIAVMARSASQSGEPLFAYHRVGDAIDPEEAS